MLALLEHALVQIQAERDLRSSRARYRVLAKRPKYGLAIEHLSSSCADALDNWH